MNKTILPDEHKYLTFLKKVFRHEFRKNGFRRISIPLLKDGILRENSEIGVMEAYIENNLIEEIQPIYFYIMDRFLSDGNEEYRIGGEILGENDPILDAIMIYITNRILKEIGLKNTFEIRINTIGIEKEKVKYSEELNNFYSNKKHLLTEKGLLDLENNPMLLLASLDKDEKILASSAPKFTKFLKKDSKIHYAKFKEYLDILNIPYIEDHTLISKNSYNTNSVWSFNTLETGEIISHGARYNYLAKDLGSPKDIPASGFYLKAKIIINLLKEKQIKIKNKDSIDLFFIQLGDEAKKIVLPISLKAREAGINTVVALGTPSIKQQMLKAQRSGAKYVVIVGVMEAKNGIFQVRDNIAGTQQEIKKEEIINYIIDKIGKESLDFYCPAKDLINE